MKKSAIFVIVAVCFSIICGVNWRTEQESEIHHFDTLMFLGNANDTMYFVVNENNDTVDWFMYMDGKKLDRNLCDYLYHLADSLKEEDISEKGSEEDDYQSQAELNEVHGQCYLDYYNSIEKDFQKLISLMPEYRDELNQEKIVWQKYQKAIRYVANLEDHGSSTPMFVDDVLNQGIRLREASFSKLILHLNGKGVLFSKTIFTSSMIAEAYTAYIEAVGRDEYIDNKAQYQEALRKEQTCWNEWMYCRFLISQKIPQGLKRYYDNCTNMVKRTKLHQLKNQNRALGMCGHEVIDCVLPDDCSDKVLLNYPGFDKVWAKHCENTDWYPKFE